ncbi:MAG: RdgB/HAM1 family non-canonical purine NTP pyrophosphatase [Bacteroidales bacterium]
MKEIVFATNNTNKVKEVQEIIEQSCGDCAIKIMTLDDINFKVDIPETMDTLEGNAILKARFIKHHTGYDCFADDTGLEISALDNAPGIYSARYAGKKASYADNLRKVLRKMAGVKNRRARFRTVIALVVDDKEYLFEGQIEGTITESAKGKGGFGYDPIFKPLRHKKTFAEMADKQKNKISHRYHATTQLASWINDHSDKF